MYRYTVYKPIDDLQIGIPYGNGSWSGVMGQFERDVGFEYDKSLKLCGRNLTYNENSIVQEVDFVISLGPASSSRFKLVDFTFPIVYLNVYIMIPFPVKSKSMPSLLSTFSPTVVIKI